ncbi:MAG: helix-turn-helix domain-containing protein [Candidatus Hodarchaeales archaeon]|jgi:predicted transcriptional regulator
MTMTQYLHESLVSKKEGKSDSQDRMIVNKTDLTVLNALLENQPATRMELCAKTGIPRTTIYDALTRLILKKVVIKYSNPSTSKGRPKVYYRVV